MKYMLGIVVAASIFFLLPHSPILVDHVYRVELNHVYNDEGRLYLDQLIFWETEDIVQDWRQIKDGRQVMNEEEVNRQRKLFEIEWGKKWGMQAPQQSYNKPWIGSKKIRIYSDRIYFWDEAQERHRIVYFKSFIESWTQYDREMENSNFFPRYERKGLVK